MSDGRLEERGEGGGVELEFEGEFCEVEVDRSGKSWREIALVEGVEESHAEFSEV